MESQRNSGYFFGVLSALCWGTSPILIRMGLDRLPSSYWGVAIGMTAATTVYLAWLLWDKTRTSHRTAGAQALTSAVKAALLFQALGGVASALGTIGRTLAIQSAPVVVVIPLAQTTSIFTLIFAPLFLGRHIERVTPKLILGALLVVAGSTLVILGQNL